VRRRAITALALAFSLAGLAAAVLAVPHGRDASAQLQPVTVATRARLLRVDSTLPAWRAPGAVVTVTGWAASSERLRLRTVSGRTLARTLSGPRGRFGLRFRAPAPGRYRLRVVAGRRSVAAGALLVRPLVLAAVGDVTFGEQVGPAVAEYGGAYPWTGVAGTLRAADVTVGNLETSVSTRGVATVKQYTFRGPPQALPPMAERAGFDVLTLANNHSMDYGPDALLDTIRNVRAAGIEPIGAGANEAQARRPAIVSAGGLRLALLGYSDVNPLGFPATQWTPGTARADPAAIAADVRAARRRADVVVCFFHWGTELRPDPDSRQQLLAAACLDAGARVVLGAHPHVFGPVTRPGTGTLVAWTLGNFVFPSSGETARTAILEVRLDREGVRGYRLLPVRIDGFRPQLVRP
jgi:poly-gamma-glutamate capsule biosynthesis protein CapA/YwtB (metallophosphatase superfamily)